MKTKIILVLLFTSLFLGCVDKSIAGKYALDNNSYILLKEDGTFQQHGIRYHMPFSVEGVYTVEKSNVTLHYPYQFFSELLITKTKLIDEEGTIYEKQK